TYLGVLAATGACYFGSTLVPGLTISGQGLLAAGIAWVYWGVYAMLSRQGAGLAYRRPWFHGSVALILIALAVATAGVAGMTAGIAVGSVTFGLITALAVIVSLEKPHRSWAHLAFVSFYELSICATGLATPTAHPHAHQLGLLLVVDSLLFL